MSNFVWEGISRVVKLGDHNVPLALNFDCKECVESLRNINKGTPLLRPA